MFKKFNAIDDLLGRSWEIDQGKPLQKQYSPTYCT